jgi:HSP20 family protein
MIANTYEPLVGLNQVMDRLFNDSLIGTPFRTLWSQSGSGSDNRVAQPLPLDVYATENEAVIVAAVPGMSPEDLDLTIHQDTVTLSGTIRNVAESEETKNATWYIHELWSGQFRRSFTLPFPVDADGAQASFEQGILRVTLPKAENAKPRKIAIGGAQPQAIESSSRQGKKK